MGSTVYYAATSLDGFIARPDGSLDWLTGYEGPDLRASRPEATRDSFEEFYAGVGAVIMGSGTYEWMLENASSWPYANVPAWVFTSREFEHPWDGEVHFTREEIGAIHRQAIERAGEREVWIVGGGNLASQFVDARLLDVLRVTVVPVWLGEGLPLFARPIQGELRREACVSHPNGMTELTYALPSRPA